MRYRLVERLGRGGTAVVWSAWDEVDRREVALKLIAAGVDADHVARRRFLREALAAQAVPHPNVVEVAAAGVDPFVGAWLAMTRYRGESLDRTLAARPGGWSPRAMAEVMVPVLDGLACAHEVGVLHRDLKPGNVFLHEEDDGTLTPKLLDFGGAKIASTDAITSSGTVFGTPQYISPEQASCTRDVDARADVWSAGVMLYRVLVGRVPFDAPNIGEMIRRVYHALPESPVAHGVPRELAAVVMRCLEKDPRDRYADARALKLALCEALGIPPNTGAPDGPPVRSVRVVARASVPTLRPVDLRARPAVRALSRDSAPTLRPAPPRRRPSWKVAPANDVSAPGESPSEGVTMVPPAPSQGSVPPEFLGDRVTPLPAPPMDIVRAAARMERAARTEEGPGDASEREPPRAWRRRAMVIAAGVVAAVAAAAGVITAAW